MIKGMPLVITYHPLMKSVGKITQTYLNSSYIDSETKKRKWLVLKVH